MATPNERLAASLAEFAKIQRDGRRVFRSDEISRVHRERLQQAGFIQNVIRNWMISSDPNARQGDTTIWYASFWEFSARYCKERFGGDWHLSPEQSLLLQAENTVVPAQALVFSPSGSNNSVPLLFGTSIYDLKERSAPPETDIMERDGLRLFSLDAALVRAPEAFFMRSPVEAQTCLAAVRDPSPILARLLDGGHSVVAGRLAGAFRHIGRSDVADDILQAMKAATYRITETNPFAGQVSTIRVARNVPPIVSRLSAMWSAARDTVIAEFPEAPGLPADRSSFLERIEEIYVSDAYHSLSIEGYRVTPELIERVRSGSWDAQASKVDRDAVDALAARGYWQAFQQVKKTVADILDGGNAADLVEQGLRIWYRELFQPSVQAGLISASAMAGYRRNPVYLRTSRFIPPRHEVVSDAMAGLFALIRNEPEASVRAVLGHWLVGYVHPYPDGNGRSARFLMNALLASGGYPWTIIRHEDRAEYLAALDKASIEQDLRPFTRFVAERAAWSRRNGVRPEEGDGETRLKP